MHNHNTLIFIILAVYIDHANNHCQFVYFFEVHIIKCTNHSTQLDEY